MKTLLRATLLGLLVLTAASAQAEGIHWVTVKNSFQASIAAQVADHAWLRDGNRFLAGLTPEQAALLRQSGLELETLMTDIDPAGIYRVMPDGRAPRRPVNLQALGQAADLGDNVTLLITDPSRAASLNEDNGYLVTPLAELSIRWLYRPPTVAAGLQQAADFPSDSVIDLVSLDSLLEYDTRLMNFRTRYVWSDSIDAARDWMVAKFQSWGYTDVSWQAFTWNSGTHYNVVVVKPGYAEPDKVIVVGGHYDTYNSQQSSLVFAPGADDNGSGTAATMEMARILADIPLRKTVIFIPFTAEEVGLIGSAYAASQFVANGTDIEVMFNYDMIGYDPSDTRQLAISGASFNNNYRDFMVETVTRLTDLVPVPENSPGGSDHQSFINQGFPVINCIEGTFNYQGWHTNTDLTSYMNFPYMTKVVQAGIASLAAIANASHPTEIEWLADQGDGSAIEVFWASCDPTYSYTVRWGTSPGVYTDSAAAPLGSCSYLVNGLQEGQVYYFSAVGVAPGAYPPIYAAEDSLTPLILPRAPTVFRAEPGLGTIELSWRRNPEADLASYRIYRSISDMGFSPYRDNVTDTAFTDTDVLGQTKYTYRITAIDDDANESPYSQEQEMWAATFDGGMLIVDEITQGSGVPTQTAQEAFWDTTLGATPFAIVQVEEITDALKRSTAGQYSSLLWFDDDLARKTIVNSGDTLDWYAGFTGNILISGLRTMQFWGSSGLVPGDFRYDELGLAGFTDNPTKDFLGAHGQSGWPDLQVELPNLLGNLPYIPSFQAGPGTTVIYTYDAASDDPSREGTTVGILKQTPNGARILLAFPVMFLTDSTATLLMEKVKTLFGEGGTIAVNGDVDQNGKINVGDLTYLVAYLFRAGAEPPVLNAADVNGDCRINVVDVTYLVGYLFKGQAEPQPGCIE